MCYINLANVPKVWDCREAAFVYDRFNAVTEETAIGKGEFLPRFV